MTEVARKLDGLLECFAKEIEAFRNGGPKLRDKHLAEAEEAGLDAGAIANLATEWDDAIAKQKVPVEWLQWFKKPQPKPKPQTQHKAETDKGPSETGAALKVFEEPQSKSEPVVPTGFTQSPTIAPVVADDEDFMVTLTINKDGP